MYCGNYQKCYSTPYISIHVTAQAHGVQNIFVKSNATEYFILILIFFVLSRRRLRHPGHHAVLSMSIAIRWLHPLLSCFPSSHHQLSILHQLQSYFISTYHIQQSILPSNLEMECMIDQIAAIPKEQQVQSDLLQIQNSQAEAFHELLTKAQPRQAKKRPKPSLPHPEKFTTRT